ncbi:MAG: hypothetical protein ACLRSA_02335 [Streptococcus salivarius]
MTDCKYRYTISPNVKKFTPTVIRLLCKIKLKLRVAPPSRKSANSGEGFPLKITINKDLTGFNCQLQINRSL